MAAEEIITNNGASEQTTEGRFWSADLDSAFAEARATGKNVLIAFGSDWCRSWRLAIAVAFMDEDLVGLSRKFVCVMVNEKRRYGSHAASIYGVRSYPTVLVCNADGHVMYRADGTASVEDLIPAVTAVLRDIVIRERNAAGKCGETVSSTLRPGIFSKTLAGARTFVGVLATAILG